MLTSFQNQFIIIIIYIYQTIALKQIMLECMHFYAYSITVRSTGRVLVCASGQGASGALGT
jgi:hypothetical protein